MFKGLTHDICTDNRDVNPLNAELNPICHLLALLGAHHIFHVSGLRVNRSNTDPCQMASFALENCDFITRGLQAVGEISFAAC